MRVHPVSVTEGIKQTAWKWKQLQKPNDNKTATTTKPQMTWNTFAVLQIDFYIVIGVS